MRIASFLALLSLLAGPTVVDSTLVNVTVQVDSSVGVISPYMNSLSLVYCWARDAIYRNGTVAAWAKHNRVATARWPAGTASYFDWRNSTGEMGRSTDDPSWKGPPAPTQDWMDLDEYLTLCEQVGMRPLIGANYNDHGHLWANLSFSVRRVTEQAQRVISRGHAGAFWYVGNEDGVMSNVDRWIQHAQAIKSEDPSAVIFFNDNHLAPDQLTSFLHKAGNLVGGAEFHGKWPHGGKCKGAPASVADWQQQVPLIDIKTNKTWRKRFAELRAAANAAGRSDLLLANNEFGLGKPCSLGDGFDRYTKSLVNIEFAMEMRLSGADVAAFWDNSDGGMAGEGPTSIAEHMLMDSSEGYRFNPVHFGLEWLATAGEAEAVEMTTSARQLHGFAALSKTPEVDGDVQVFLLNKYPTARPVEVCVEGGHGVVAGNASTLTDGDDHWGTTIHNTLSCNNGCCSHHMPPLTFSRLVLTTGDDGQPR